MKFKFGSGALCHHEHCTRVSGSVVVLSLETLEQSRKFAKFYKKYNQQRAGAARVDGRQAGPRALLHALR